MNNTCVKQKQISKPIIIPTKKTTTNTNTNTNTYTNTYTNTNTTTQYSLKQNCFNPNKASPPNSWNYRLMHRISDEIPARSP